MELLVVADDEKGKLLYSIEKKKEEERKERRKKKSGAVAVSGRGKIISNRASTSYKTQQVRGGST